MSFATDVSGSDNGKTDVSSEIDVAKISRNVVSFRFDTDSHTTIDERQHDENGLHSILNSDGDFTCDDDHDTASGTSGPAGGIDENQKLARLSSLYSHETNYTSDGKNDPSNANSDGSTTWLNVHSNGTTANRSNNSCGNRGKIVLNFLAE